MYSNIALDGTPPSSALGSLSGSRGAGKRLEHLPRSGLLRGVSWLLAGLARRSFGCLRWLPSTTCQIYALKNRDSWHHARSLLKRHAPGSRYSYPHRHPDIQLSERRFLRIGSCAKKSAGRIHARASLIRCCALTWTHMWAGTPCRYLLVCL